MYSVFRPRLDVMSVVPLAVELVRLIFACQPPKLVGGLIRYAEMSFLRPASHSLQTCDRGNGDVGHLWNPSFGSSALTLLDNSHSVDVEAVVSVQVVQRICLRLEAFIDICVHAGQLVDVVWID